MDNTANTLPVFDTCPTCKQIARVTNDTRIAKHGGKHFTCKGTGLTAPSFIVSAEPVITVFESEVAA